MIRKVEENLLARHPSHTFLVCFYGLQLPFLTLFPESGRRCNEFGASAAHWALLGIA